ncbi:caspase activity and apoptosis inhibitor 1 [Lampetra fluviatilis]
MPSKAPRKAKRQKCESPQRSPHPTTTTTAATAKAEGVDEVDDEKQEEVYVEEGGTDLDVELPTMTSLVHDRPQLLEQSLRAVGDKQTRRILPPRLSACTLEEVKALCLEQLMLMSDKQIHQVLQGEPVGSDSEEDKIGATTKDGTEQCENRQNSQCMDTTSAASVTCTQPGAEPDDEATPVATTDGAISCAESDALSLVAAGSLSEDEMENVGKKEQEGDERKVEEEEKGEQRVKGAPLSPHGSMGSRGLPDSHAPHSLPAILHQTLDALLSDPLPSSPTSSSPSSSPRCSSVEGVAAGKATPVPGCGPAHDILELELRARAIKSLMKANERRLNS